MRRCLIFLCLFFFVLLNAKSLVRDRYDAPLSLPQKYVFIQNEKDISPNEDTIVDINKIGFRSVSLNLDNKAVVIFKK